MNRIFRKLIGGAEITIRFCAPFSLAANIRGLEPLTMDMYADPYFARGLFDRIVEEVLAPWVLHLKKKFPKVKNISGDDAAKESSHVQILWEAEGETEQVKSNSNEKKRQEIRMLLATEYLQIGGTDGQEKRQGHRKRVHDKTDDSETEKTR